jgi:serine-type D-Ala-D-Ala carboxypeptidase (penicillin-binding protein 5/6)
MKKSASMLVALVAALSACASTAGPAAAASSRAVKASTDPAPLLPVTGASLLASGQQTPLWSESGNRQLAIASTTKMMTFLVVVQHATDLNSVLTQNDWRAQSADSQIGLTVGEKMTVRSLLYALMLPSADDAAEDLAYNLGGGSIPRFIAWMNADAVELGLRHTHYSTPIGLDTPGNYSSPDDLARLGDYMMRHWPIFQQIVGTYSTTISSFTGHATYRLVNTNDLLEHHPWILGIKTGHTIDAGYLLVAEGRRHGLTLIASVTGTDSEDERDDSALKLLDWGFASFHTIRPVRAGERLATRHVPYETAPALIVAERGYETVVKRGAAVHVALGHLRKLAGPMAQGARVGYVSVAVTGRKTVRIALVLKRALPAVSGLKKFWHTTGRPITLILLVLFLSGTALYAESWRRRLRRRRRRAAAKAPLEER